MLTALGQAFFSLSLGMGAMLTYGSYLPARHRHPQGQRSGSPCSTRCIALLSGVVVFPITFSFGMEPRPGRG